MPSIQKVPEDVRADLSQLEKKLEPVKAGHIFGRAAHKIEAGWDKLIRLFTQRRLISREEYTLEKINSQIMKLDDFYGAASTRLLKHLKNPQQAEEFKKLNNKMLDQLVRMQSICNLIRSKVPAKAHEDALLGVESLIQDFMDTCAEGASKVDEIEEQTPPDELESLKVNDKDYEKIKSKLEELKPKTNRTSQELKKEIQDLEKEISSKKKFAESVKLADWVPDAELKKAKLEKEHNRLRENQEKINFQKDKVVFLRDCKNFIARIKNIPKDKLTNELKEKLQNYEKYLANHHLWTSNDSGKIKEDVFQLELDVYRALGNINNSIPPKA